MTTKLEAVAARVRAAQRKRRKKARRAEVQYNRAAREQAFLAKLDRLRRKFA